MSHGNVTAVSMENMGEYDVDPMALQYICIRLSPPAEAIRPWLDLADL